MGKISVQRALTEIKTIDARVERKINSLRIVEISKEGKLISGQDKEEFKKNAESSLHSLTDLIKRKALLKRKINESNLITKVLVLEESITVIDAILLKDVFNQKEIVFEKIKIQLADATRRVESINDTVNSNALKLAQSALGKDNVEIGEKDVDNVILPYLKMNLLTVEDPLNVLQLVMEGQDQTIEFFSEIDIMLSESNALTMIEV